MTLVEILREASTLPLEDEDGEPVSLELQPPLTADELARFAESQICPLPEEVEELLLYCRGVEGFGVEVLDFTGESLSFGHDGLFPHGLPVAGDGYGNFWVLDLLPDSQEWGPVYFACHDPPVVLYQAATLGAFLRELIRLSSPPHTSEVDDVHEDRLFEVWRDNPGVLGYDECVSSNDEALAKFARTLDATFQLIDLRHAPVGFGFSWGRYGAKTVVRRAGHERIFAYQRKESLIQRILGKTRA